MHRVIPRWTIKKRDGQWRVYDRGVWVETFNTLQEAHTEATRNAVADILYQPGGLTLLAELKTTYNKANPW